MPAERETSSVLGEQRNLVEKNLHRFERLLRPGRALAILNERRQLLAANGNFSQLTAGDIRELLGMRLGEALGCVHSSELPGGCGTTVHCRGCGNASAILDALRWESGENAVHLDVVTDPKGMEFRMQIRSVLLGSYRLFTVLIDPAEPEKR
jgi:hypothetical protein